MIKVLQEKFPNLYCEPPQILIPNGWLDILDDASEKLERLIREKKDRSLYRCYKVWEDRCQMCFSMSKTTREMREVFSEAAIISKYTCEICGQHGIIRGNNSLKNVICDECVGRVLEQ